MNELIIIALTNDFKIEFDDEIIISEKRYKEEEILYNNFKKNKHKTLLEIVFNKNNQLFSPSLTFYINITKIYIKKLTTILDIQNTEKVKINLNNEEINTILENKMFVQGNSLIDEKYINNLIENFNKEINTMLKNHKTVTKLLDHYNYKYLEIGRVIFNLVITKDSNHPFAFMATYQSGMNKKILPLKEAIIEYKNNNKMLLHLLAPVYKSAKQSKLIKNMLDDKRVFLPNKFTDKEAYTFLKETQLYEESGIHCRIPDFWKNKNKKVKASFSVGGIKGISINDIIDVNSRIMLGDISLTIKEAQNLLKTTEGLALIKGKWVEINHTKLQNVLNAIKIAQEKFDNLSIIDVLKLELNPDKLVPKELKGLVEVTNGDYLNNIFNNLIFPKNIKEKTTPSKCFNAKLREYQKIGLNWLTYMKKLSLGACLADDMGLGKTIQIIALLSNYKEEKTLLVVPASLLGNWKKEFEKFLPSAEIKILHPLFKEKTKNANIHITTYNLVSKYEFILKDKFDNLIIDESQNIKNPKTKQSINVKKIKSNFKIALTGTPIENRLSDLYSLFDFLNQGLLGSETEFKKLIRNLEESNNLKKLKNVVSPFILRRLKTDKKIITDLPEKLESKKYIILSEKQKILYKNLVDDLTKQLINPENKNIKGIILPMITKFKQICNHPAQYLDNKDYNIKDSSKFILLEEIAKIIKQNREKVLVFTQFREIIPHIKNILTNILGQGLTIDGNTNVKKRTKYVNEFNNNDNIKFMVLSLKAGGTGLNLTAANHVIHFDRWWNPAVENQATDRAYRIGQNKNVNVYKFITTGTIEEKIDEMIEAKKTLANEIITSNEEWLSNMNKEEILNLFKLEV